MSLIPHPRMHNAKERCSLTDCAGCRGIGYSCLMANDFTQSSRHYLTNIDAEIERLQQLRSQVASAIEGDQAIAKPARKGMSPEGRKRIAEAQKARWATQNKAFVRAAKKAPAKKKAKKIPEPAA